MGFIEILFAWLLTYTAPVPQGVERSAGPTTSVEKPIVYRRVDPKRISNGF